jgi:hypothetical protein
MTDNELKQAFLRYHQAVKKIHEAESVFNYDMPFRMCTAIVNQVYRGIDSIARWFGVEVNVVSFDSKKFPYEAIVEYDGITYYQLMETKNGFGGD